MPGHASVPAHPSHAGATAQPRATGHARTQGAVQVTPSATRWLLLIHHIPPKPDYLRVKTGRRLARVGAVPIKNSVYVLPSTPDAHEDFQWIVREIVGAGGEACVSEGSLVGEGLTDEEIRERFNAARNAAYRDMLADARSVLKSTKKTPHQHLEQELAKLRRRYEAERTIDFFEAAEGIVVAALLSDLHQATRRHSADRRRSRSARPVDGATWVTRRGVHVDRIASAWLIRRFIDRRPRFRFVDAARYHHAPGELRFDMFEAEYTHVGDACTFETLMGQFVPGDPALREIAEIVHDVDCKDAKFRREEAAGVGRMVAGIATRCPRDEDRLERGSALFDDLYAAFGGEG